MICVVCAMTDNNRDRESRLNHIEKILNIKSYLFDLNKIEELELLVKSLSHYKAKKAKQKLEEVEALMKEIK